MTSPGESLADRRARLVARCAENRVRTQTALSSMQREVARVDGGIQVAGRWLRKPLVVASGMAVLLAIGRARPFKTAGLALGLLSAGLKVRRLGRTVRTGRSGSPGGSA